MADVVATATVTKQAKVGPYFLVHGIIAFAAGDYAAGGLPVSFAGKVSSSLPPVFLTCNGLIGYEYRWAVGTTIANGKIKIYCETTVATNAPLLEHTVAAAHANIISDVVSFIALFPALR